MVPRISEINIIYKLFRSIANIFLSMGFWGFGVIPVFYSGLFWCFIPGYSGVLFRVIPVFYSGLFRCFIPGYSGVLFRVIPVFYYELFRCVILGYSGVLLRVILVVISRVRVATYRALNALGQLSNRTGQGFLRVYW